MQQINRLLFFLLNTARITLISWLKIFLGIESPTHSFAFCFKHCMSFIHVYMSLVLNRCSSTLFMNGFKFGWYQKIKCLEQLIKLVHISVHVSWFFYMIDLYILDQSIFHKYESVIYSTNVDLNFV